MKQLKIRKLIFITIASLFFVFYFFSPELYSLNKVDIEQEYSQHFALADKFRKDGKFDKSAELFEKSLSIAKRFSDKEKECESLQKLGLLNWNIGQLKESSVHYEQALKLAQKLNLKDLLVESQGALEIYRLYKEGKRFRSSGDYTESIESFQQAIDLAREAGSKEHELKCLRQMSVTYFELDNLHKYLSLNKDALNIAQNLNHRKEEGNCLYNIGFYYWKLDNYSKALNYYEDALKIAKALKNIEDESTCLTNIGVIYEKIGDYDKALEYLKEALTIDKQLGNDIYISIDLNNIGETFRTKGLISGKEEDFYKAQDYFYKCLKLTKKAGDRKAEVYVLNNIGSVHTDLEKYYEALKYFKSGYKKAEEIKDVEAMGMILTNIGIVHYNQGNYEKSTEYYQEAIHLINRIEGGQIRWEAYMESARADEKQNKCKKAKENYEMSIKTIETIRTGIELEEHKASFLGTDKRIDAYHYFINLLLTFPPPHPEEEYKREAFNSLEKAKARAFLDSLELSKIDISQDVDPELLNRKKEIEKNISNIYTKIRAAELSPKDNKRLQEELERCENDFGALKREIRIKNPAYAEILYPEIISLQEAQRELLDSYTAFFVYCIGKEHSYAFVITKKDFRIFPLPPEKISKVRSQTI